MPPLIRIAWEHQAITPTHNGEKFPKYSCRYPENLYLCGTYDFQKRSQWREVRGAANGIKHGHFCHKIATPFYKKKINHHVSD